MCMGLPMRITEQGDGWALAEGDGGQRTVSTLLVGDPGIGTWVLVHLDTAREVLSEAEAQRTRDALEALQATMRGDPAEHLLADLIDQGPTLPPHLRTEGAEEEGKAGP